MRVLVTGAYGFIGAQVVAALITAGHVPVAAVRSARRNLRFPDVEAIACDFAVDTDAAVWERRLAGIDAVVNCAGILRERGADTHERVHEQVPRALFEACSRLGVRRVVQISALGDPRDGEFIASKHRADAALMASDLDWVVLRPSVVVSTRGSYGGTSLLRALAALPWIPLPGAGDQRLQPVDIDDLCRAVVAALTREAMARQCLELGGPQAMTLRQYLGHWRGWLGLGHPVFVPIPKAVARFGASLAERFGDGPLGLVLWRMLERGNVVAPEASARASAALGFAPAALAEVLAKKPSGSADRWHARLHFLAPALRLVLAGTWIASGIVGLSLSRGQILPLFAGTSVPEPLVLALARGGSIADVALGLWLLSGWQTRAALAAMAAMVMAYSLFIGTVLPAAWLDPYGGLIKNGVLLLALAVAAVTSERN